MEDIVDEEWSASDIDTVTITCPSCGEMFTFGAWTLVNAQRNPDAAAAILDGSLFEFTCPACGYEAHLMHPCLYLDPDNEVCIYLVIDDGMAAQAEALFSDPDNSITTKSLCRIVCSREELAEKILTFSAHLDDRPIELLKFGIIGSAKMDGIVDMGSNEAVVRLKHIEPNDTLEFSLEYGDASYSMRIPVDAYTLFANALAQTSLAEEKPLYVTRCWGEKAMDVIERAGGL